MGAECKCNFENKSFCYNQSVMELMSVKIIISSAEENYNTVNNVGMNRIYGNVMNKSYNKCFGSIKWFF